MNRQFAFYRCTSLEEVTIPSSVTSIGNEAFCGCGKQGNKNEYKMNTVNYTGSKSEWEDLKKNIGNGNDPLLSAKTINYNYKPTVDPTPVPDDTVNLKAGKTTTIDGFDKLEGTKTYESNKPTVATVDENGNITTHKRGTVTISCTVTDSQGNVITVESINVKVNYTVLQWILIVVTFGIIKF